MAGSIKHLLAALNDPNPLIRREAIIRLGELKDKRAVEPLIHILKTEPENYEFEAARLEVVNTLRKIGDSRAIKSLLNVATYGALSSISGQYQVIAFQQLARNALESFGEVAVAPIIKFISQLPLDSRYYEFIWLLRKIGHASAIPHLIAEMYRPHQFEGIQILEYALVNLGAKDDAVRLLVELFENPKNETMRIELAKELIELGDQRAVPYLALALKNTHTPSRLNTIHEALRKIAGNDTEISKALLEQLRNPDYQWFYPKTITFLADLKVSEAIPEMLNALRQVNNRDDLLTIQEALEKLEAQQLMGEPLIDMLNNPLQSSLHGLIASLLAKLGDQNAIPHILAALHNSENRDDNFTFELALRQLGYNSDSSENPQ